MQRERDVTCQNPDCRKKFHATFELAADLPKGKSGSRNIVTIPTSETVDLNCEHCGQTYRYQLVDVLAGFDDVDVVEEDD